MAQCLVLWTAQTDLHFHPWANLFIPTPSRILWQHSSHTAVTRQDCSLIFPSQSTSMHSFIQLSELGWRGENENAQTSKRSKGDPHNRRRSRVGKSVGHLYHVWSYGVREVVSSIPDRGNIVGWVFHPTRWLVLFSLIWKCLSFQILNLFI